MKNKIKYSMMAIATLLVLLSWTSLTLAVPDNYCYNYLPGDANGDGLNLGGDVTKLVRYFSGGDAPYNVCPNGFYTAADANGSCVNTGADVTRLVQYFRGVGSIEYCPDYPPRPIKDVYDADISLATNQFVTWHADTTYILKNFVFVDSACELTIEAGTIIKGEPGQGANAKALIVALGGKIHAHGTASEPIIFTSTSDYTAETDDLPLFTRGLWGGVIILGYARTNLAITREGTGHIEGIPEDEERGSYGGNDDTDDSGEFYYVSIRHGGSEIGAANEINGLTMGAVGSGTDIHHVEVFCNLDDGFEWFGGTVRCHHLLSAFCGDDNFDYDEGYRGWGQFWFSLADSAVGDRGGEHDGGTNPEDGTPYAQPYISNATYVGAGVNSENPKNDPAIIFRDNAGGHYRNSIYTDYRVRGLRIEDLSSGEDACERVCDGELSLEYTSWGDIDACGTDFGCVFPNSCVEGQSCPGFTHAEYMQTAGNANVIELSPLVNIDRHYFLQLCDPRSDAPTVTVEFTDGNFTDPWFDNTVNYRGAFNPADNLWTDNWTAFYYYGVSVH